MRTRALSVKVARSKVKAEPGRWRAALIEDAGVPMNDRTACVVLFEKVGEAEDSLTSRLEELTEEGYAQSWGSKSRGFVRLAHVDTGDEKALAIDKRRSPLRGT